MDTKRTIRLQATSATSRRTDNLLPDVTVQECYDFDTDLKDGSYQNYLLPELGQKRILKRVAGEPLVLPIGGRRFEVRIEADDEDGIPEPGVVTFIETDAPETPYELWDGQATMKATIALNENRLAGCRARLAETTDPEARGEFEGWIRRLERDLANDIAALACGKCNYDPGEDTAFGQPNFVQFPVFPTHNGKTAACLLTLDTGWGDCGNENYFVVLDDEGWPVAVFHEANCS